VGRSPPAFEHRDHGCLLKSGGRNPDHPTIASRRAHRIIATDDDSDSITTTAGSKAARTGSTGSAAANANQSSYLELRYHHDTDDCSGRATDSGRHHPSRHHRNKSDLWICSRSRNAKPVRFPDRFSAGRHRVVYRLSINPIAPSPRDGGRQRADGKTCHSGTLPRLGSFDRASMTVRTRGITASRHASTLDHGPSIRVAPREKAMPLTSA
jgi:hypothetical protein